MTKHPENFLLFTILLVLLLFCITVSKFILLPENEPIPDTSTR